jgi:hypothetical protein
VAALSDVVKDPAKRRAVVDDCTALIDAEVGDKRGLTGVAIKTAYMTVKNIKPGFIASEARFLKRVARVGTKILPSYEVWENSGLDLFKIASDLRHASSTLSQPPRLRTICSIESPARLT